MGRRVGDDRGLGVAVAPPVALLHEVVPELALDERAGRAVELALHVAPVDCLLEAPVAALRPCVLRGPEGDLGRDQDGGVEEDEAVDTSGVRRRPLERQAAAERVPQPGARLLSEGGVEVGEMIADPPRRLAAGIAVSVEVRGEDAVVGRETGSERLEVPAPRGDAVEADDRRRAVVSELPDVQPAHQPSRGISRVGSGRARLGPRPPMGAPGPLRSP